MVIVFNRTSANGIKILQFKENTGKMEALRMEDNQKFCELDSDEDNEKRIEYQEKFRQYLAWKFTNEDGLFVKEEINEKTKVSLTDLGKHLFGYLCVTSNIPYKEIKYYLYLINKRKPIKQKKKNLLI